jgi:hypothetical protein
MGWAAAPVLGCLLAVGAAAAQNCEVGADAAGLNEFREADPGTVTDSRSRLTWMRCALGQVWSGGSCLQSPTRHSWDEAKVLAEAINASGEFFYDDWRLPTLRELATITRLHCRDPRTDLSQFPGTQPDFYWSSSTKLIDGPELVAFALSFGPQGVRAKHLDENCYVRLVRTAVN